MKAREILPQLSEGRLARQWGVIHARLAGRPRVSPRLIGAMGALATVALLVAVGVSVWPRVRPAHLAALAVAGTVLESGAAESAAT
jgi:hypothetical protein